MNDRSSNSGSATSELLGSFLRDLKPADASYCRTEVTRPWGVGMPFEEGVRFHFVAEGQCWALVEGAAPERLDKGDVVLLPHGTKHAIADNPASAVTDLAELGPQPVSESSFRLKAGGGGARSLILCCTVAFEEPLAHRVIGSMPTLLVVRNDAGRTETLRLLLDVMAAEMARASVGSATVMARLADAAISMIIRDWTERSDGAATGWVAAMRDPALARALLGIHTRPGEEWSLDRLASTAAMSRSAFADRFASMLGVSPGRYVAEWRMQQAKRLLADRRRPIAEVAIRLGYSSEAGFSRAFKRITGTSPGSVRSGR